MCNFNFEILRIIETISRSHLKPQLPFLQVIDLLMLDVLLQLQHDYILGNYPIGRDDASQLSALQILAEIGFVSTPESGR